MTTGAKLKAVLNNAMRMLLFFLLLIDAMPRMTHAQDSLRITIYHKGERIASAPEIFPRHRPFTLLLHARSTLHTNASMVQVADTFAAVHKLSGLQYYSHSERKLKTLFSECAVLEHPRAHKPLKLPRFRKLPLDTTFYIRQVDSRIGPAIYRATLHADAERSTFFLYNVDPVSKFGVQLVESGDFLLYIHVQRTQPGVLELQAWQWMRFKDGLLGLFVKEESFVNRLKAVVGFYERAFR